MLYQITSQLAVLRAKHGRITQSELARKTGITQKQISALESGGSQGIRFETLAKLCAFFNCTPNDLLALDVTPEKAIKPSNKDYRQADAVIARALTRAMAAAPRSADEVWAQFDLVREKISDQYERNLKKRKR